MAGVVAPLWSPALPGRCRAWLLCCSFLAVPVCDTGCVSWAARSRLGCSAGAFPVVVPTSVWLFPRPVLGLLPFLPFLPLVVCE